MTVHWAVVAVLVLCAACGGGGTEAPAPDVPASLTVSSPVFGPGRPVPARFTCQGTSVSPPLRWSGVPAAAKALALVVDDPDAPHGTYVHWLVVDVHAGATAVPEGQVPAGGTQARNSSGHVAYAGPCPPSGTHHYRFTVYALRSRTGLADGAGLDDALAAIDKRAVARGRLTGTVTAG